MSTSIVLTNPGDSVELLSDGVNYQIVGGFGSSINPGAMGAAPGDVTGLSCSGFIDPITNTVTLTISATSPGGTFTGYHFYLELPDQSAGPSFVLGVSALGSAAVTGPWAPFDLGRAPYASTVTIDWPAPAGFNSSVDTPARLYAASVGSGGENKLVRFGLTGATPSVAFNLVSKASGTPTAGTSVTQVSGAIAAAVLPDDNTTGKLRTPVLVTISTTPITPGWVGRLVLTYGASDPTDPANQVVVGSLFTKAGPVYASPDGVPVPHSFALDTPKSVMTAVVWAQSGLVDAGGNYQWNKIVPGITPEFPITIGTTAGTTDAASVILASITASMAVVNGLFGVAASGITNSLLGASAVATINVQNLAITNPLLAALSVQASNLGASSVTATAIAALAVGTGAIQTAAITNALIANLAVGTAQIQSAAITSVQIASATIAQANLGLLIVAQANIANLAVGTAQLQNLAVTDAKINDLSANKITVGTIAAVTITTATINGGAITGTTLVLNKNGLTVSVDAGVNGVGTYGVHVMENSSGDYLSLRPHSLDFNSGGSFSSPVSVSGATISMVTHELFLAQSLANSATAGSVALPSNPVGFVVIKAGFATSYKLPAYAM